MVHLSYSSFPSYLQLHGAFYRRLSPAVGSAGSTWYAYAAQPGATNPSSVSKGSSHC